MVKLHGCGAPTDAESHVADAGTETLNASVPSPELAACKVWSAGVAPRALTAVTTLYDNLSIGAAETAPVSTHQTTSRLTTSVYISRWFELLETAEKDKNT
jgi:hypothetical protein